MKDLPGRALLDDFTVEEHDDPVRDLRHHRQVVGDVDGRHPAAANDTLEGPQHLDLGGHVDGGGRLVEHEQARLARQRHRGHEPLKLSPAHLVGILAPDTLRIGELQAPVEVDGPRVRLLAAHEPVDAGRLGDLVADGQRPR